ncbi:MAG TPA: ABC transporter ATP-binding protein [bacterium]|nr:ABC transporter ATP-binding protein [bacterium]
MTRRLVVEDVTAGYGAVRVLQGVSLRVAEGEVAAVIGPNAAGKSTLLRTISGMVRPARGRVGVGDVTITGWPPHRIARLGVAHCPEGRRLFPNMTVLENLELGTLFVPPGRQAAQLEEVYRLFPRLQERRGQLAGSLSGGEQQMLAIARSLVTAPEFLLLDEPSTGLAPLIIEEIFRTLAALRSTGLGILLVEQNVAITLPIADRVYVLDGGRVAFSGPPAAFEADSRLREVYLGLA